MFFRKSWNIFRTLASLGVYTGLHAWTTKWQMNTSAAAEMAELRKITTFKGKNTIIIEHPVSLQNNMLIGCGLCDRKQLELVIDCWWPICRGLRPVTGGVFCQITNFSACCRACRMTRWTAPSAAKVSRQISSSAMPHAAEKYMSKMRWCRHWCGIMFVQTWCVSNFRPDWMNTTCCWGIFVTA